MIFVASHDSRYHFIAIAKYLLTTSASTSYSLSNCKPFAKTTTSRPRHSPLSIPQPPLQSLSYLTNPQSQSQYLSPSPKTQSSNPSSPPPHKNEPPHPRQHPPHSAHINNLTLRSAKILPRNHESATLRSAQRARGQALNHGGGAAVQDAGYDGE